MPIRYMGTKRDIASRVSRQLASLSPKGLVLDLFSGIGCVAESLTGVAPVHTNDALSFTALVARARFKGERELSVSALADVLREAFRDSAEQEARRVREKLRTEQRAIDLGYAALSQYMSEAQHVANSPQAERAAAKAARATGIAHYRLMTQYFAAGYFSTRQAIQLDALRYAIDTINLSDTDRDWALAAWISAAATIINAPGHTAQYLKSNNEAAYRRIRRCWIRSTWDVFQNELINLKPIGTSEWRALNRVDVSDAIKLLKSGKVTDVSAIYADPPYTKDQYSRYYHLYETMYLYDYPTSCGAGRTRSDRFISSFCLKTEVEASFHELFSAVASLGVPLVLSYPSHSLLSQAQASLVDVGAEHMHLKTVESFDTQHSTLGASKGATTKSATENVYVYVPCQ
jgi:adenine-specific DNA-methyltransferase